MAYSVLGKSKNVSLSWRFGDTPRYRFALKLKKGVTVPPGTTVVFALRSPYGLQAFEETHLLTIPADGMPYFDVVITPQRSYTVPPGNYTYSVTFKRPSEQVGEYQYTTLAAQPCFVTGQQTFVPVPLSVTESHAVFVPPAPTVIVLDDPKISQFFGEQGAATPPPEPPPPAYVPPSVSLGIASMSPPFVGDSVTPTLQAAVVAGSKPLTGVIEFKIGMATIHSEPAAPAGGTVSHTVNTSITATTTYSVTVTDGQTPVTKTYTVTFSERPSSIFWGVAPQTPAAIDDLLGGMSRLQNKVVGSPGIGFALNGNGFAYIAYPAPWGNPNTFLDHSGFNVTSSYTPTRQEIEVAGIPYLLFTRIGTGNYDYDLDGGDQIIRWNS